MGQAGVMDRGTGQGTGHGRGRRYRMIPRRGMHGNACTQGEGPSFTTIRRIIRVHVRTRPKDTIMRLKLTITIADDVYRGLHHRVGRGDINRFIEDLVRPHVVTGGALEAEYRDAATD